MRSADWECHVAVDLRAPTRRREITSGDPRAGAGAPTPEGVRCDGGGLAHVAVLGETVDLVAEAPGHVPLAWTGPPQDLTLSLRSLPELDLHVVGLGPQPPGARVTVTLTAAVGAEAGRWISGRRRTQDRSIRAVIEAGRGRARAPALGEFSATLRIAVPGAPEVAIPLRPEPAVVTADTHRITLHR